MRLPRVLLMLMRVLAGVQVVLGVGFWTGHWYGLVPVHIVSGVTYVLLLWGLAIVALVRRHAPGLASFAIVWGLVIPALGFAQFQLLAASPHHWIVRVVHLVVGLAAMPIAERLARVEAAVAVAA